MKTLKSILKISIYLLIILVVTFIVTNFIVEKAVVTGASMEPGFLDGDQLLAYKCAYSKNHGPKRFDVVVFPSKMSRNTLYVKRVIALPGERVRIADDGTIYINEEPLNENYGMEPIADPGNAASGIILHDNEYFVLGDNRNNSIDSRFDEVGKVRLAEIRGKAIFRIWPLDRFGGL